MKTENTNKKSASASFQSNKLATAIEELEQGVFTALETYSNVHRGSGHHSMVTTHLFEKAREIILEYLDLNKSTHVLIFCTPRRAETMIKQLPPGSYKIVSSQDVGLSIGVRALAVKRKALPRGTPFQTGGGTTRLVAPNWVVWANAPDRFEAGTPAIINIIAFTKALRLKKEFGIDNFMDSSTDKLAIPEFLHHDEFEKNSGLGLLAKLRSTMIKGSRGVPTMNGVTSFVNLDNSASTPTFTPVWNAFRESWRLSADPKQEIIHEVRSICAGILNAPSNEYDVIFTSNTTEAINLVAESASHELTEDTEPVVVNSLIEHSSNDLPWRLISNGSLIRLSVDAEGFFDLKELEALLKAYNEKKQYGKKRINLVAVNGASNVLGTCNNLEEIGRIVYKYNAQLLVDAAQLVAHRKIDMKATRIDYLAFSAHKVYAPFGCGVLLARKGLLNYSGPELENIHSSGEENLGGIAALGKALVLLQRIGMDLIKEQEMVLTEKALRGLSQIPGLRIFGVKTPDSPGFTKKLGVIVFDMKGVISYKVAKELALQKGIGVRYGCHCAHIAIKHLLGVGPFLERFQRLMITLIPKLSLPGLVRVSIGIENSEEDIDQLIHTLRVIAHKPTDKAATEKPGKSNFSKAEAQQHMNDFVKDSALKVYS